VRRRTERGRLSTSVFEALALSCPGHVPGQARAGVLSWPHREKMT
jgi:hypothetical protein